MPVRAQRSLKAAHPIFFSWAYWQFCRGILAGQPTVWTLRCFCGSHGSGPSKADARLIAIGETRRPAAITDARMEPMEIIGNLEPEVTPATPKLNS